MLNYAKTNSNSKNYLFSYYINNKFPRMSDSYLNLFFSSEQINKNIKRGN